MSSALVIAEGEGADSSFGLCSEIWLALRKRQMRRAFSLTSLVLLSCVHQKGSPDILSWLMDFGSLSRSKTLPTAISQLQSNQLSLRHRGLPRMARMHLRMRYSISALRMMLAAEPALAVSSFWMRIGPSDSTSSHLARLDKASVSKMAKTQWRVDFSSTLWALGVGRDGGGG